MKPKEAIQFIKRKTAQQKQREYIQKYYQNQKNKDKNDNI